VRRRGLFLPCAGMAALLIATTVVAEPAAGEAWYPHSENDGRWDWVQLDTGEWIKGEIIAMYNDELEFESDHFDTLTLDWADIAQIHSSRVVSLGLNDRTSATGKLIVDGDTIRLVDGDAIREFRRSDVMSITGGAPKESNFWTIKFYVGGVVRTGNSEVREGTLQADLKRRTIRNRIQLEVIANQNTTDDEEVTNNQRVNFSWNRFIRDRFFVTPALVEYFRDRIQNIAGRYTLGVGVGYQFIDRAALDWRVSGGPGYQETRYDSVQAGSAESESTPALIADTIAEWDITQRVEFDGEYRIQIVNEASGRYNHHVSLSFETEITKRLEFDVEWTWDRIAEPRSDSTGDVPEPDDFRTTVGLTFEF
jgi:putative salt-induced outer membrane protein YdiY